MTNREVELLAIGGGPANLALAVALEELGIDGLAENSLVIERGRTVEWQRGLLLPWTKSQVAFAKDLVTLRNPRSEFTFLNYLRCVGRLDDFINMGSFTPYRVEISGYLSWVARTLRKVKFELGVECTSVAPLRDASGVLTGWLTKLADGSTISSRYLVIGAGRDPYVPPVLAGLPADRLVHSTHLGPTGRFERLADPAELRHHGTRTAGDHTNAESRAQDGAATKLGSPEPRSNIRLGPACAAISAARVLDAPTPEPRNQTKEPVTSTSAIHLDGPGQQDRPRTPAARNVRLLPIAHAVVENCRVPQPHRQYWLIRVVKVSYP
ncbi:SidA/IucD/PvdA family monooxygenase [Kribbella solani]|uniref:SidA/IucD/PvdA family monooxygenase n=1 Tax=Kribbella solani TaxID=236067 RepID=UPI0029AFCC4B|nr:SidA/IucD/PvdA family monooxygenase [Kribbella solani]MDX3001888.1 SidA/IucD/PvdA family monooxygenase [Kribbella solani]